MNRLSVVVVAAIIGVCSGHQAWVQGERPFENQTLILDHFAELPVLVAAVQGTDRSGTAGYRVAVVEKDRGMVRFNQVLPNSADFHAVQIDWKNGTIDLCRYDLRVRIAPEPEQKRAGP